MWKWQRPSVERLFKDGPSWEVTFKLRRRSSWLCDDLGEKSPGRGSCKSTGSEEGPSMEHPGRKAVGAGNSAGGRAVGGRPVQCPWAGKADSAWIIAEA